MIRYTRAPAPDAISRSLSACLTAGKPCLGGMRIYSTTTYPYILSRPGTAYIEEARSVKVNDELSPHCYLAYSTRMGLEESGGRISLELAEKPFAVAFMERLTVAVESDRHILLPSCMVPRSQTHHPSRADIMANVVLEASCCTPSFILNWPVSPSTPCVFPDVERRSD